MKRFFDNRAYSMFDLVCMGVASPVGHILGNGLIGGMVVSLIVAVGIPTLVRIARSR